MNCDAGQSDGFISKGCREFEMTICHEINLDCA